MVDPIIAVFVALMAAMTGPLFVPLMGVALAVPAVQFMSGRQQEAQSRIFWVCIGGAVLLGAIKIATALQSAIPK